MADETRTHIATSLRASNHLLVGSTFDDATLDEAAELVDRLQALLAAGQTGAASQTFEDFADGAVQTVGADWLAAGGAPFGHFRASPVSGTDNPMSYGATQSVDGEHAIANVTLGPAFVGAPGRAHGGIVAAMFDEVMGMVAPMQGQLAFTGWLRVDYAKPCPIGVPLEFRAWHGGTDGRKMTVLGEAQQTEDGVVFATATGLFINAKRD